MFRSGNLRTNSSWYHLSLNQFFFAEKDTVYKINLIAKNLFADWFPYVTNSRLLFLFTKTTQCATSTRFYIQTRVGYTFNINSSFFPDTKWSRCTFCNTSSETGCFMVVFNPSLKYFVWLDQTEIVVIVLFQKPCLYVVLGWILDLIGIEKCGKICIDHVKSRMFSCSEFKVYSFFLEICYSLKELIFLLEELYWKSFSIMEIKRNGVL